MQYENMKLAMPLWKDIEEMKKYKGVLRNGAHKNSCHFEFIEHYGTNPIWTAKIPERYNSRFIALLDQIIEEAERELKDY